MNQKADFLQKESIRIDSHNESNRIDSNRELECSTVWLLTRVMNTTYHGKRNGEVGPQLVVRPWSRGTGRVFVHATPVDKVASCVWRGRVCVDVEMLLKVLLDQLRPLTIRYRVTWKTVQQWTSLCAASYIGWQCALPTSQAECARLYTGHLQIQPNKFPTDFQEISRIHFLKFQNIFTRQAIQKYQNAGEVCNVYNWARDEELRPTLIIVSDIIVILFTGGLPYVQYTRNRLTCEHYIANYKIFHERQLNSKRFPVFPGVVDTLVYHSGCRDTHN